MNNAAVQGLPSGSTAALILGLVVLCGTLLAVSRVRDRRLERRLYWSGCLGGGALLALAALPHGPRTAIAVMIAFVLGPAIVAVRYSPYLKVGRRIIATRAADRRPDPPRTTDPDT